ncbi:hypothetical protein [Vibrio gazogenes]|uniref:hypothetical protein n=1 Tax=Vibrio gazogenes TaxID=687 RepID=UPI0012FDA4BC|nr:hypothetical protein [Vibrio gazogenes]
MAVKFFPPLRRYEKLQGQTPLPRQKSLQGQTLFSFSDSNRKHYLHIIHHIDNKVINN